MVRRRSLARAALLVTAVGLLATACSDGLRDAARVDGVNRSASSATAIDTTGYSHPIGDPEVAIDADSWCLRAQDSDGDSGFMWVANITGCNVMTNATRRFTAPGRLDGVLPLGVTKAYCSQNDFTCVDTSGSWYGEVRTEGVHASNVADKGDRYTKPNPFLKVAAIQFMPKRGSTGVETQTFLGSNMSPFSLSNQSQVQLHINIPYWSSTNYAWCENGRFIQCHLDSNDYSSGKEKRFNWTLTTLPLQIQVNNNSGRPMTAQSTAITGAGYLLDPNGTSTDAELASIPAGGTVFVGGYRRADSDDEQSWTANYVIKSLSGDVPVAITIKMAKVDNKWVNQSRCEVSNRTATSTFKCNTPTLNDSDSYRQAIVTITDF